MAHLVEVSFRGNRKEFFLWDYPDPPPLNAAVIVDVDRGEDLGHVYALGDLAEKRNGGCSHGCGTSAPERKALRLANPRDRASAPISIGRTKTREKGQWSAFAPTDSA